MKPEQSNNTPSYLHHLMTRYQTSQLVNTDPHSFRSYLEGLLDVVDWQIEGFNSPEKQRDLSIKFHWGHDHDFGDFSFRGRMGERHITLLAQFIDVFHALPRNLSGCRVLDIGCWTGGTSLLLCAMGAQVVAIDEVKKYIDALRYLKHAFHIENLEPLELSLYDCIHQPGFQDAFDYILFAGVLYHVTDPILALRILYNCLKDNGTLLLESAAINASDPVLWYEGPQIFNRGSAENLDRGGWNWFIPSPPVVSRMMDDVGYSNIQVGHVIDNRVFAVGGRGHHADMMRGGLSLRTIR